MFKWSFVTVYWHGLCMLMSIMCVPHCSCSTTLASTSLMLNLTSLLFAASLPVSEQCWIKFNQQCCFLHADTTGDALGDNWLCRCGRPVLLTEIQKPAKWWECVTLMGIFVTHPFLYDQSPLTLILGRSQVKVSQILWWPYLLLDLISAWGQVYGIWPVSCFQLQLSLNQ